MWERVLRIARAYKWTTSEVWEMDYVAYNLALKDLGETPFIDWAFYNGFMKPKDKTQMTAKEKQAARRAKQSG